MARHRSEGLAPKTDGTPIRIVRFTVGLLGESVETHIVEGMSVKVFGIAKTIADCFRYLNKIGRISIR
jgi:predicted transcriptional regulator of viral defense system